MQFKSRLPIGYISKRYSRPNRQFTVSSKGVQFKDDAADKPYPMKHVPTQRYYRKEIQKRLDLENWIDDQLKELCEEEVSQ